MGRRLSVTCAPLCVACWRAHVLCVSLTVTSAAPRTLLPAFLQSAAGLPLCLGGRTGCLAFLFPLHVQTQHGGGMVGMHSHHLILLPGGDFSCVLLV